MDKTIDDWAGRLLYFGVAVILALGLLLAPAVAPQASAAGIDSEWEKEPTPDMDDWFVTPGFMARDYAVDEDDTVIYAIGLFNNTTANASKLLKSEDGGATWKDKTKIVNDTVDDADNEWVYNHVAVAPDNPDFVALALTNNTPGGLMVLFSYDGGKKFRGTGPLIGLDNITDIGISPKYGDEVRNIAAIGDDGTDGAVERHRFESEKGTGTWIDATTPTSACRVLNWSNCTAVTSMAWSPNFVRDSTILVVTSGTANGTVLQHGYWDADEDEDMEWNNAIPGINPGGSNITTNATGGSGIALPTDYDGDDKNSRRALVFVNNGPNGTIYTVDELYGSTDADPIEKQIAETPLLASLDYCGDITEGKAVAGEFGVTAGCEGRQVYRSGSVNDMDIEKRWISAADYKLPSGNGCAVVSYATSEGDKIYALTHGWDVFDESALSVSFNDGESWNQVGLINTDIGALTDAAMAADCNTTILASVNHTAGGTCGSTWLKSETLPEYAAEYNGKWLRVWYGDLTNGIIRLAPEETEEINNVYLAEFDTDTLYYTESAGLVEWELDTKAPFNIADLAVKEADSVFAISAIGEVALFNGNRWPSASRVDSELDGGNTIAVLGDSVLVGGDSGDVSYSSDGGENFAELKNGLPDDGDVFVAFDSYFDTNSVVYAAVRGDAIYRWTIDKSDEWTDITKFTAVSNITYTGIVLDRAEGNPMTSATDGGVLYASYCGGNITINGNDTYVAGSGMVRCLTPASEKCCGAVDWDNIDVGLSGRVDQSFNRPPSSLKICGCLSADSNSKLYAIDTSNPYYNLTLIEEANDKETPGSYDPDMGRLAVFVDCFAKAAPTVTAPEDNAVLDSDPCECWNDAFTLKWDRQCDACNYSVQISLDEDFTELLEPYALYTGTSWGTDEPIEPAEGATPSLVILNGALGHGSCGTTYYWRIRSREAETGQVIRSPWSASRSFTISAGPEAMVTLTNPTNGAVGVATTNIPFTWDAVPDATGYTISLVNAATDAEVVASTAVDGTTYTYTGTLAHETPFLWTVQSMKGTVVFGEATATFTTVSAPVEVPPARTPAWVWVVIGIGALLVIATLVLIFRTRRV